MTSKVMEKQAMRPRKSSNASAAAFGWDFQSNAAIMIMLQNIKRASSVKVESATEDIEITLENGKTIYSQSKSVFKPDDHSNVISKLQDALKTLDRASESPNTEKLIYVTNSPNPFKSDETMWAFSGGLSTLDYGDLPDLCKDKVEEICKARGYSFNRNMFSVYVMQFHGDGQNRYKIVRELTNELLTSLGLGDRGLGSLMLEVWQRSFFENSSHHNLTVQITKSQMIWPLIVQVCGVDKEDALLTDCDTGEFEEIRRRYSAIINNNAERFEFVTKVLSAYNLYEPTMKSRERTRLFIERHWNDFRSEFDAPNMSLDIQEAVVKLAISNVIKRRYIITDVKKGVNL